MERKSLFEAEDTEDLIQQQEEFIRSGKAPAAQVVRVNKNSEDKSAKNSTANSSKDSVVPTVLEKDVVRIGQLPQTTPDLSRQAVTVQKKKSLFKQSRDRDEDDDVALRMRVGDRHISHVMTQIVERDHVVTPVTPPPPRSTAFPPVKHRSELNLKRVKPQPARLTGVNASTAPKSNADIMAEVDAENTAKLGNLSATEISELQQEIFTSIDPKLVARLKQRGAARMNKTTLPNLELKETSNANTPMTRVNPYEVIDLANKGFVYDTRDTLTPVVSNIDQDEPLTAEQLEREKTQWMTPVTVDTSSMTDVNARPEHWRYDFAGHRVTGVSAEQYDPGLYHHGDQPELPGYTLQELLHLMSSTVKKQRALAVHVVANILQNWKQSADQSHAAEVLTWAIQHKLPLLVRRALDEGPEALVSDALRALHALLVNARDAEIYDEMATTWHGACIWPLISEQVIGVTEEGEAEQLTDVELSQRDVWTAVLQTGLLTRVRYVLEVMRPQSHVIVELILDLCLAAARHSESGVNHVLSCPRLLHVITRDFVHVTQSVTRDDTPYRPHPKALQLLQLCCESSLDTCQRFLGLLPASPLLLNQEGESDPRADDEDLNKSAQGILPLVIAYFVRPPRDLLQHTALPALTVQTLRLWLTCVRYGLTSELFLDIYHVIIEHITHLQTKKEILDRNSARVTTALFLVLEGLLDIAVVNSATTSIDHSEISQGPVLHWSHVSNLFQPSLLALDSLMTVVDNDARDFASIREHVTAVASILHFLSSYFKHLKQLPEDHVTHVQVAVQQLSHVISKYVAPLTKSKLFRLSLDHVTQLSNSDESRGSLWLQTLPCLTWSCQTPTSIAAQNSVLAVTRLLYMVMALIEDYNQLLDEVQAKHVLLFLDATLVQSFQQLLVALLDTNDRLPFMTKFGKALDKKTLPKLFTHVPSRRLAQSLVMLLNMVHRQQISTDLAFMKQLPSLAMHVIDQLLPGDELLVLEVFEHVILNRQVYLMTRDHVIGELSRRIESHSVKSSFSEQHVIMSQLDQHRDSLVEFIDFYFGMVLAPYELPVDTQVTGDTESRAFTLTRDFVTRGQLTHVIALDKSVLPLNGTWLFWPLHYAHRSLNESEDSAERDQLLHEFVQHFVQQYIRVTCFLSIHNTHYFMKYPADVLFLELGRLFLLGPQICADPVIDSMAAHVIRTISARGDLALDSAGPTTAAKLGDIAEIWLSEGAGGQALATWLLTALPAQCANQIWSTLATAWTTLTSHVTRPLHALVGDLTLTRVKSAMTWLAAPQVTEELRNSDLYWALVRHVTLGVFSAALGDEWSRQQWWSQWIKSQRPVTRVVHDVFYFWTEHEPLLSHTQLAEQPPIHVIEARAAVLRGACEDDATLRALMAEQLPADTNQH